MPRINKDIGDLIPARGEAEVMARVKGAYGSKSGGYMRGRTKRSKFARLRRMPKGREADWVVPLGPGSNPTQSQGDQLHMEMLTPQDIAGNPARWWAFVLHPGLRPDTGTSPQLPWVGGLEEYSESARYRVMGMAGDVYYTPQYSSNEEIDPPACVGFIAGAWYKVQRSNAIDIEGDGTTIVNPPFRSQFPYRSLNATDSTRMAAEEAGFGVPYPLAGTADYREEGQLVQQDWRLVEHAKPIGMFCKPWRADFIPAQWGVDDTGQPVTQISLPTLGPAHPVRLPMPRKLVANIGRDEALALYLMAWNNPAGSNPSVKAPKGLLTYPTFRVKLLELD